MTDQVSRITAIDSEIKRLQNRIKELKIERSKSSAILLKTMDRTGKDEIGGIKRSKIEKKPRKPTKPITQKKKDAIDLFSKTGIQNPEKFWEELQKTQKVQS